MTKKAARRPALSGSRTANGASGMMKFVGGGTEYERVWLQVVNASLRIELNPAKAACAIEPAVTPEIETV